MKTRPTAAIAAVILAIGSAAPVAAQEPTADTVLATVGGTEITLGHVIAMRQQLPPQYQEMAPEKLYEGLLDQLIQQAALAGTVTGELSKQRRLALENQRRALRADEALSAIGDDAVTEQAVEDAYAARFADAQATTQYNAAHILVDTKEAAQAIVEELEGGADFAALAREKSTGPSSARGGKLGWFDSGQMVAPFDKALAGLEPGEISDPVETQFGWHVVKLNDTRRKDAPDLGDVRDDLTAELRRKATGAAIDEIVADADVQRREPGIDPGVLDDTSLLEE